MSQLHDQMSIFLWLLGISDHKRRDEFLALFLQTLCNHSATISASALVGAKIDDFRHAIRLDRRGIALSAVRVGNLFRALGQTKLSKALYEGALTIDSLNVEAAEAIASDYRQTPEFDVAIEKLGRPQPEKYKTPLGTYYVPADAKGDIIVRRMKAGRLFQEEIISLVKPYIKKDSAVIDLGANLGQMTLAFSDFVGDRGSIYSVEANEFIFHLLKKNVEANHKTNVRPIFAAAFDKDGEELTFPEINLVAEPTYGSHGLDLHAVKGQKVMSMTVDSLTIEKPLSLIKVDIQGADLFALRGAVKTIERHRPAIVFELEEEFQGKFGTSRKDYFDFVEQIGYRVEKTDSHDYLILPK